MEREWCHKCQALQNVNTTISEAIETDEMGKEVKVVNKSCQCAGCNTFIGTKAMTIKEIMNSGMLYTDAGVEELSKEREQCQELLYDYNHSRPSENDKRKIILRELLGQMGEEIWIEPPFRVAYGYRTHIGDYFYANFNLVIVDDVEVTIGHHVMIAPNVTITATGHPVYAPYRKDGSQFSFPVTIGNHVWIGANAIILPGITIGDNSVIGAGSVVTKDIPANVVAAGNPCGVIREISEFDKTFYAKDRKVISHDL